jgi:hypothetical protein
MRDERGESRKQKAGVRIKERIKAVSALSF